MEHPIYPDPPATFDEYIQRLPEWERDLLTHQCAMQDDGVKDPTDLPEALTKPNPLFIVSDASNRADKNSAFHWVIATPKQYLWEGSAMVPGPASQVNTGRSEGFGGLASLRFLYHFCRFHKITPAVSRLLYFCDNKGFVTKTQWLNADSLPVTSPTDTIQSDYDVKQLLVSTIKLLGIPTALSHVKGHQDGQGTALEDLDWEAQLNIHCDVQAKAAVSLHRLGTSIPTPFLPGTQAHLTLDGTVITSHHASALRRAATSPAYRDYLIRKFTLTDDACDDVHWAAFRLAINRFKRPNQTRIQKFIHRWLPLNEFLHVQEPTTDPVCPACLSYPETQEHFLCCQHPLRTACRDALKKTLDKFHDLAKTDPHLSNLLWVGILHSSGLPIDIGQETAHFPEAFKLVAQRQSEIGWTQLMHGRLTQHWGIAYESHCLQQETSMPGDEWIAKVIQLLWEYFLALWKVRNADRHGRDHDAKERLERARLELKIRALYAKEHDLTETAARGIFQEPIETLLERPLRMIRSWLIRAEPYITQELKSTKIRRRMKNSDIRTFFPEVRPQAAPQRDASTHKPP
jgi:hypothetical protein